MKFRNFVALLLIVVTCITVVACGAGATTTTKDNGGNGTTTPSAGGTTAPITTDGGEIVVPAGSNNIYVKFFKVGKANATLVRTENAAILIDNGENDDDDNNTKFDDGEKILEYLAEKSVTKIDLMIVSQFNKNHYGSTPTILEGITVEKIIEPDYNKTGAAYEAYTAALTKAGITPEAVNKTTTLTIDGATFTIYPATTTTAAADQDEFYSLAVSVEIGEFSLLLASDIYGQRVTSLITELNGKKFDILQIPMHGAYYESTKTLIEAVTPEYAIIFASLNNPEDVRITNILTEKNISFYVTKGGSVEAKYKDGVFSIKQ